MLKTKRLQRYLKLQGYGFLKFEAYAISAMYLEAKATKNALPFLRQMIIDRKQILRKAQREHWNKEQYKSAIHTLYEQQDWVVQDTSRHRAIGKRLKSVGRDDVWAMVRHYEELYRGKVPSWESPAKPRRYRYDIYGKRVYERNELGRRIDKGLVAAQRKRWKEKQERKKLEERES